MHGQKIYEGTPPKTAQAPRFRQAAVGSEQRAATLQARYWCKVTPSRHGKTWQDMALKTASETIGFL